MNNFSDRIRRLSDKLTVNDVDCIFITPSADLRYFTGYNALPLERLTCLAVRSSGEATLIVPRLELAAAQVHDPRQHGITVVSWEETQDPFAVLAEQVGSVSSAVVNDVMWAQKAFGLQHGFGVQVSAAGSLVSDLRAIKSEQEIAAIVQAGQAIDTVHHSMGQWLAAGRTEREVGRDIADAIYASGHESVDFVIVGSGPNGASPHHELSDRVIGPGEPIVVDIGGTMPSGYCSDSTRMYVCGEVADDYMDSYRVLQHAQALAVSDARVGMSGAQVDALAREVLLEAGLGEHFIHRTGHGLGLETHEEPYIVASNHQPLVAGNVFSIEPGFYIPHTYGARIEDIVYLTEQGAVSVNNTSHDIVVLP